MIQSSRTGGDYFLILIKGFLMGTADIIPGVSGGTIAFITGIYEELIYSICSFDKEFLKRIFTLKFKAAFNGVGWKFLCAVLGGILFAIVSLSSLLSWLLENKTVYVHAFFFGLILATVPIIGRVVKSWNLKKIIILGLAVIASYYIVTSIPRATPEAAWFVFFSGAIAISAMILPGISGSFILVVLGKYQFILDAVNNRDLGVLCVFVGGILVGILTFVRVLGWLFSRFHDETLAALTGVVIGSLIKIWPWKMITGTIDLGHGKLVPIKESNFIPSSFSSEIALALLFICVGFTIAFLLDSSKKPDLSDS